MPNITIIAAGKLKKGPLNDLKEEYLKRIQWPVKIQEIDSKQNNPQIINKEENQKFSDSVTSGSYLIVMDETGKTIKSKEFSEMFERIENQGISNFDIIIGGADGISEYLKKKADFLLSFGKQTWPHMMARVMLLEQIYRAQQIRAGHPYHRE